MPARRELWRSSSCNVALATPSYTSLSTSRLAGSIPTLSLLRESGLSYLLLMVPQPRFPLFRFSLNARAGLRSTSHNEDISLSTRSRGVEGGNHTGPVFQSATLTAGRVGENGGRTGHHPTTMSIKVDTTTTREVDYEMDGGDEPVSLQWFFLRYDSKISDVDHYYRAQPTRIRNRTLVRATSIRLSNTSLLAWWWTLRGQVEPFDLWAPSPRSVLGLLLSSVDPLCYCGRWFFLPSIAPFTTPSLTPDLLLLCTFIGTDDTRSPPLLFSPEKWARRFRMSCSSKSIIQSALHTFPHYITSIEFT